MPSPCLPPSIFNVIILQGAGAMLTSGKLLADAPVPAHTTTALKPPASLQMEVLHPGQSRKWRRVQLTA